MVLEWEIKMGSKKISVADIEKIVQKNALKHHIELVRWLYDNHKKVLREWEATRGNSRIEFAGGEK